MCQTFDYQNIGNRLLSHEPLLAKTPPTQRKQTFDLNKFDANRYYLL